jgi:hypothetical protein
VVKKKLVFISAENFKNVMALQDCVFTFRLKGKVKLMGQKLAIWPLKIKND